MGHKKTLDFFVILRLNISAKLQFNNNVPMHICGIYYTLASVMPPFKRQSENLDSGSFLFEF